MQYICYFNRGHLLFTAVDGNLVSLAGEPELQAAASMLLSPVLLFSKLNKTFFRYFDSENIFLDNKNK